MAVELNIRTVPHTISGYTGHCPQYKYHGYIAYGAQSHRLFDDPNLKYSNKNKFPIRTNGEYSPTIDLQLYTPQQRAEELSIKYKHITPKPFTLPLSPYDPYEISTGPNTIYKDEHFMSSYAGHVPGRQYIVGKRFAYISYDAKKWLRWSVNGVGWQHDDVYQKSFIKKKQYKLLN